MFAVVFVVVVAVAVVVVVVGCAHVLDVYGVFSVLTCACLL